MISFERRNTLSTREVEELTNLVIETFNEFVGVDYSEEGKNSFYEFINDGKIFTNMLLAHEFLITAKVNQEIVGIITTRERAHISLLFVRKDYQGRGISRDLLESLLDRTEKETLTVNSSPYALEIYKKLGFVIQENLQEKDGIKFIPMEMQVV